MRAADFNFSLSGHWILIRQSRLDGVQCKADGTAGLSGSAKGGQHICGKIEAPGGFRHAIENAETRPQKGGRAIKDIL